jgi:hypothetical protein
LSLSDCGRARRKEGRAKRSAVLGIAPDIDAERDRLMADLDAAGQLAGRYE